MTDRPVVLVVDDRPENLVTIEAVLESLDVTIHKALRAEAALHFLLDSDAAVILLDVEMPGIDGFETARLIRSRPRSHDTPIMFITAGGRGDPGVREGYELGAVEYLIKPFHPDILRWKVSVFAELYKSRERERLLIREQVLRAEAETNAQRARLLGDIGRVLASDIVDARMFEWVATPFVPDFADCAAIYIRMPDGRVQLDSIAASEPDQGDSSEKITLPPKAEDPLFKGLSGESPILVEDLAQEAYRNLSIGHRDFLIAHKFQSGLFIPIRGRREIDAILALYRSRKERFGSAERGFADELSDRIALRVRNIELYRESERVNRAKDEFLAVVSHELRTPLVAIVGWARILLSSKMPPEAVEKALRVIQRSASLQTTLINDILDFSKITAGKLSMNFEEVNARIVLEEAVESLQPSADAKNIHLVTQFAKDPPVIFGDPNRLQQLFSNLLSNSLKFTPQNGTVQIVLRSSAKGVEIEVRDTGIGIEPEFLPHVFEPFVQADSTTTRKYPGLGLGLAIVRRLVELHHGDIRVESDGRGQGAAFTITLPRKSAETRAS
jgi:signal transduction histidine kinase/FixJ family two-component response regulator